MSASVVIDPAACARLLANEDGPAARALLQAAVRVETDAKRRCPVDTGRLRSSITHQLVRNDGALEAWVGTNVEYAPYVELGTRTSPAQPFLRPALSAI